MIAVGRLAYELTAGESEGARAIWLGIVGFVGRIPTFIFAPLGGVFVDRWDRWRVAFVTQIMAMIQAALLAVLTLLHVITLGKLILLSLMLGLINAAGRKLALGFDVAAGGRAGYHRNFKTGRAGMLPAADGGPPSLPKSCRLWRPNIPGWE